MEPEPKMKAMQPKLNSLPDPEPKLQIAAPAPASAPAPFYLPIDLFESYYYNTKKVNFQGILSIWSRGKSQKF
jgi:hypothetical protein